jgi:hypothetical protein
MSKSLKCLFASFIAIVLFSSTAFAADKEKENQAAAGGTIILKDGTKIEASTIVESISITTAADQTQIIRKSNVEQIISKAIAGDAKRPGVVILKAIGQAPSVAIEASTIVDSISITTKSGKEQTIASSSVEKIISAGIPSPAPARAEIVPLEKKENK